MRRRDLLSSLSLSLCLVLVGAARTATAAGYELENRRQQNEASELVRELVRDDGLGAHLSAQLDHNRDATAMPSATASEVAEVTFYEMGFRWNPGDQDVPYWIPQGITGSGDAYSDGVTPNGRELLVVSWHYDTQEPGASSSISIPEHCVDAGNTSHDKGVRLSFVDITDWPDITYRHVMLVEPFRNADGRPDLCPVPIHAGGIAWYGRFLYVVDSRDYNGNVPGIRLFDTWKILEVDTGNRDRCGRKEGGGIECFDYRYVLPQYAKYDQAWSAAKNGVSFVSVDRSSDPHSIVSGDFCKFSDPTSCSNPDYFRWNLDPDSDLLAVTRVEADREFSEAAEHWSYSVNRTQGLFSRNGHLWFSRSRTKSHPGILTRISASGAWRSFDWAVGPEDLTYSRHSDHLWSLTEYAEKRSVFAVKLSHYR